VGSSNAQAQERRTVSVAKLGNVLHCLKDKLANVEGYEPPEINPNTYRIRYRYGINSPEDENDKELQLFVYSAREKSAIYYTVYFDKEKEGSPIEIGQMGTLVWERDKLVLDENPGGNGTYFHIQRLSDSLGNKPAIVVGAHYVRSGEATCIYQH
jgi:hypothetical protein